VRGSSGFWKLYKPLWGISFLDSTVPRIRSGVYDRDMRADCCSAVEKMNFEADEVEE
jgi:hypothetical protein